MPGTGDPKLAAAAGALRERSRQEWNSVADAWDAWEPHFAAGSWPVTQKLIAGLCLSPHSRVLDVGCGVGNPALEVALALAPHGSVLAIDPAEGMVACTSRRADALGITNLTCRVTAAEDLAEPAASFDAVVARFALMFMADVPLALRHLHSLLRPGGRIAVSVWAPHQVNPMFALACQELAKVVDLPKPGPNEPGPMRLSRDGELTEALTDAGFHDVHVEPVRLYQFARDPADYWNMVTALAPGFRREVERMTDQQRQSVRRGLMAAVAQYASGPVIRVPALAQVGTATA